MAAHQREWINEHDDQPASDLLRAVKIAFKAHMGQTDKTGEPYFLHCKRVADAVSGGERVVAYLHDVVEKGPEWTLDRLRDEDFTPAVIEAVDALTRRSEESDEEFVTRALANELARPVKIADLKDNLAQAKESGMDPSKYQEGLRLAAQICCEPTRPAKDPP
ncbi:MULTISPECIES: HD domain-containing protein [unclassified Rhizobium]|uniref:HD domain-containing protein n=1 Tax=unclassified Rhizobium TaxID=2613769 RepID=UPI002169DE8D|nr:MULTISPECIES: HD domain-containing protein [unclassified Rhizobium]MCS3742104.1 (p)ppGpp synthase/HD superfamily hydrolase [Rhizobium sp. BK661]MCS4094014.1 (p)ppGpp synthase/HD superfamily hydrolase [Rhizobium sp. BK176]